MSNAIALSSRGRSSFITVHPDDIARKRLPQIGAALSCSTTKPTPQRLYAYIFLCDDVAVSLQARVLLA
jgi:hypothetical protein